MSRIRLIMLSMLAVFAFSAVATATASASNDEWEVCEKGGTEKWSEHKCNAGKGTGEWSWRVLAAGEIRDVVSNIVAGTTEVLTVGTKVITCTSEDNWASITGGKPGTDLAEKIVFDGCTTKQAGCLVHTAGRLPGIIVLTNIPTKLEQRKNAKGEEVVVDNFEQKENAKKEKEFVTLAFEAEAGKSCSEYPETKVKGTVAAQVINLSNGELELNFPEPKLEKDTLEAFGLPALFTSRDELSLENGWALRVS